MSKLIHLFVTSEKIFQKAGDNFFMSHTDLALYSWLSVYHLGPTHQCHCVGMCKLMCLYYQQHWRVVLLWTTWLSLPSHDMWLVIGHTTIFIK